MIRITIYQSKQNQIIGFKSCGHAGYAESGSDIICSAVSILLLNAVNSIENFTDCDFECEAHEDDGKLFFKLKPAPTAEAELLLKSLVLGLTGISQEYGNEYIKLIFKEV